MCVLGRRPNEAQPSSRASSAIVTGRSLHRIKAWLVLFCTILVGLTWPPGSPAWAAGEGKQAGAGKAPARLAAVTSALVADSGAATELRLRITQRVVPKVSTLAAPYRVVMDFPETSFRLPPGVGRSGSGLISAFRYGYLTPRSSRLVIDATGPFTLRRLRIIARKDGRTDLVVEMAAVAEADFVQQGQPPQAPPLAIRKGKYDHKPSRKGPKPVVVIDPGHGGPDPGAISRSNLYEKQITLDVSRRLRKHLSATGRYRIIMTRMRDIYVSLGDRVQLSRNVGADLFLSLHADATEQAAGSIRGASIYTLSRRASTRQAELFARKENASDALAGFSIPAEQAGDGVESILIDLLKRETQVFSYRAREAIIDSLGGNIRLARDPRRSAAFKVLKQTGTPSVLIELGYISNPADEREMRDPAWQDKTAAAIARAVDIFFQRKRSVMR